MKGFPLNLFFMSGHISGW